MVVRHDQTALIQNEPRTQARPLAYIAWPPEGALTTEKLGERLPNAVINFVERCGHNLPREYTDDYLKAAFELYPSGNQP